MVSTIKFSQFADSVRTSSTNKNVGLSTGLNAKSDLTVTWTTATRPSPPFNGLLGYNTDLSQYEYWDGVSMAWVQLANGDTGTVTEVDTGTGLTGGPITQTGTISFAPIAAVSLWANTTGGVAVPAVHTLASLVNFILPTTTTDNQVLLSRNLAAPVWSTATYPPTTTVNQILYSSANNVISEIPSAINGVLITDNTGVPSLLPNSGTPGFVLTANAGAPPSWQAGGGGGGPPSNVLLQQLWVNDASGNDANDGGLYTPFKTMNAAAAFAALSANAGNRYVINVIGFASTSGVFFIRPYIDWNFSTDSRVSSSDVQLHSSFSAVSDVVTLTGYRPIFPTISIVFSGTSQGLIFLNCNFSQADVSSFYDPLGSCRLMIVNDTDTQFAGQNFPSGLTINQVNTNFRGMIFGSNITYDFADDGTSTTNYINSCSVSGNFRLDNSLTKTSTSTIYVTDTFLAAGFQLVDANWTMIIDSTSYQQPVVGGTATYANITINSLTDGVATSSQFTPVNYTNVAGTYPANSSTGWFAGIDAVLVSKPINQVLDQRFLTSGTYTPTAGMVYCILECWGGGGGGGGVLTGVAQSTGGGGGGAGGYSRIAVSAATIGASQTVTCGSGGAGGAAGNNNGANGGDTSVGTICIAKGGTGGGGAAGTIGQGGAGGVTGTGTIAGNGMYGSSAGAGTGTATVSVQGGQGGSTNLGSGGLGGNAQANGSNGTGNGCGGGGGATYNNGGSQAGGNGIGGAVVITEYLSV